MRRGGPLPSPGTMAVISTLELEVLFMPVGLGSAIERVLSVPMEGWKTLLL